MDVGWYQDPFGRFEQRFWDGFRWTNHVANGSVMSVDHAQEAAAASSTYATAIGAPQARSSRRKRAWRGAILALLVAALGTGGWYAARELGGPTKDERYHTAVTKSGLTKGNKAVDKANALRVCASLVSGEQPQGSELDSIGVKNYCPEFSDAFKVLETATVTGTFELLDYKSAKAGCDGQGGYGDINSTTAIIVKSSTGAEVARSKLGQARVDQGVSCIWTFKLDLTEGETKYIVSVGHRGESSYTWEQITAPGAIALYLGL